MVEPCVSSALRNLTQKVGGQMNRQTTKTSTILTSLDKMSLHLSLLLRTVEIL